MQIADHRGPREAVLRAGRFVRRSCRALAEALEERVTPAVFSVLNDNNAGAGSLRQAIADANAAAGADEIVFDAAYFAEPRTITIESALPQFGTAPLTISGPGAALLNVQRSGFAFDVGIFVSNATRLVLSGMTVSDGNPQASGGGLRAMGVAQDVLLDRVVFTGNRSGFNGGAVWMNTGGALTVRDSRITNNSASGRGGGISFTNGGALVVERSTIAGNAATSGNDSSGGGIFFGGTALAAPPAGYEPGTIVVRDSTIAHNSAGGSFSLPGRGGGVGLDTFTGTLLLENCTLTGNSATDTGGGASVAAGTGSIVLRNSTVAGNFAHRTGDLVGGGGLARTSFNAGTITVVNSVVSGNHHPTAPDILTTGSPPTTTVNVNHSAVGSPLGFTASASSGDNLPYGASLMLGLLADNGGPAQTLAPHAGSPLINAGGDAFVPAGLAHDQRGAPFDRVYGTSVDIGAVEVQPPLTATAHAPDVTSAGATQYAFTVTYVDNHGIDVATLDGADVRVTGPGGFAAAATFVGVDVNSNGTPRTATYAVTPPGGSWDFADEGAYAVYLEPGQVGDVNGNFVPGGVIGSFAVALPRTFEVSHADDAGPGSLRDAIVQANAAPGFDTITFAPAFFGTTPRTIALLTALPVISGSLSVDGPGAALLTVRRDAGAALNFRVLASSAAVLNLSGLTVRDGRAVFSSGGGSTGGGGTSGDGGGLHVSGAAPHVTLDRVVFTGNTATHAGGAIYLGPGAFLTLRHSTVAGNTATVEGGGVYCYSGGSLLIDGSTISGNTASGAVTNGGGGGIFYFGTPGAAPPAGFTPGAIVVRNSTIANNTTAGSGGGILLRSFSGGALLVQNATIAGNAANHPGELQGGGGIARTSGSGGIAIVNSVVAGNTAGSTGPDLLALTSITPVDVNYSAVGSAAGFNLSPTSGNNLPFGANLLLGQLTSNGGPTQTMAPRAGSPLIDAGSDALVPAGVTTDQRGPGFPRVVGPAVDVGAVEVGPDVVAPVVEQSAFAFLTAPQALRYTFSEDVSASLGVADLLLENLTTGQTVAAANLALAYDPGTETASFTFPGFALGALPDGNYRATLLAAGVTDPAGNPMATDHVSAFFFLNGDANRDARVNLQDFNILAANFGQSGRNFAQGDFNYDATVNLQDFNRLAGRFGTALGPAATARVGAGMSEADEDDNEQLI